MREREREREREFALSADRHIDIQCRQRCIKLTRCIRNLVLVNHNEKRNGYNIQICIY